MAEEYRREKKVSPRGRYDGMKWPAELEARLRDETLREVGFSPVDARLSLKRL